MSFFEDSNGRYWPIASIHRMARGGKYSNGSPRPARIYLKHQGAECGDHDDVEVDDDTIDSIVRASSPCLPAQAGFTLLEYNRSVFGDEEDFIDEYPIIGWRVTEYGSVEPLILDTYYKGWKGNHGVLEPTGKVSDLHGSHYLDRASWENDQRASADHERKRQQELAEKCAKLQGETTAGKSE